MTPTSKMAAIQFCLLVLLQILNQCAARVVAPTQEIVAPQPAISGILYQKSLTADHLYDEPNTLKYAQQRDQLIQAEQLLLTGGHLQLDENELTVHQIFMRHKLMELTYGMQNPHEHAPALHFFKAKPLIEQSNVFKFLQAMPKGAILHVHRTPAVSVDWLIGNLTYTPGLLKCFTARGSVVLSFREDAKKHGCRSVYYNVQQERERTLSRSRYDSFLGTKLSLYSRLPELEYNDQNKVWRRFEDIFDTVSDTIGYEPVFRMFHWQLMEEMYEDNIMYAELRMKFKPLYGANGTTVATEYEAADILLELIGEFKRSHPSFLGLKIIYVAHRGSDDVKMFKAFQTFKDFHERYPDFVIGFDLIGQEDKGKALQAFASILQNLPKSAKYFFHAGETNWLGSSVDLNLVDAILLNTTRIGHGYSLMKHPLLSKAVKERDIALEISPLSNQVLNLVWDLRNHPGGYFMSENIPLVISNDDPGFWNAKGLSYDFYYAIMSFAPSNAGLKTLKSLVWNSIKYSALSDTEKEYAYAQLQSDWSAFLDRVISGEVV
ncbi:adenosine deaminase 2-like [Rhagoletis pomonella]|uniref:adenosine deaminase 2-like n=1 Tax=Rhagoletis pomonella TaxID=28610 RepID=UPI0017848C47|nr:adenosine deaminase 2-like [Rhagoletis pomonella]XP_036341205.1 adenosine deaminase 2-like [Rhagoletis pomonella]